MKLTAQDKEWLRGWGHDDSDFPQIEEAMHKNKTTYELDDKTISREQAINLLGRCDFIAGLSRSAFHYSAVRFLGDGRAVYFDSSNLFR